jgi:primosomal protein N' (replication factor Y)
MDPSAPFKPLFARVVFPTPVDRVFDYTVPPELQGAIAPGSRVWAPFGRERRALGVVVDLANATALPAGTVVKPLLETPDPEPHLDADALALARWTADRWFCSWGEAVFAFLPLGKKKIPRRLPAETAPPAPARAPFAPTPDQQRAVTALEGALAGTGPRSFLLWGDSASGKTEVHLHAAQAALNQGKSVLYLVPEIGLTPQTEAHLRGWFGPLVGVWHSEISPGARVRLWGDLRRGRRRVLLGARSAVLAPLPHLGLAVVDEEHDPSYKQDTAPRYHARDLAREKARRAGAVLVLSSATPSLESLDASRRGESVLLRMDHRVADRPRPRVHLVDMRARSWYLSDELLAALKDRLARKEQSFLFLNRRGYAPQFSCRACGWEAVCPQCDVRFVFHKTSSGEDLRCHRCFHRVSPPPRCPACGGTALRPRGRGTQRVCADLRALFPAADILRWDSDATAGREGHARAHADVAQGRADVVVGTRAIAQGLDFPRVTLVGVLDADRSLGFPDFRAAERTFQLLAQVAGRAGRADRPGEVFLQTHCPDHHALQTALTLDYAAFAETELAFRREMGYPPFARLVHALSRSRREEAAEQGAESLLRWLEERDFSPGVALLGPAPSFRKKRAGWTQWQVIVKCSNDDIPAVRAALKAFTPPPGVALAVDVDPEELD